MHTGALVGLAETEPNAGAGSRIWIAAAIWSAPGQPVFDAVTLWAPVVFHSIWALAVVPPATAWPSPLGVQLQPPAVGVQLNAAAVKLAA
ncbi:MAG TPA: hypothetical protein VD813_02095, partial [Pseudonocardia sp.]|nr:hypothetical protein [Pseudonocardia sp.]